MFLAKTLLRRGGVWNLSVVFEYQRLVGVIAMHGILRGQVNGHAR